MKTISLLGSTGSIGKQTIDVVQKMNGKVRIKYLSAYENIELLIEQTQLLKPKAICIGDKSKASIL